MGFSLWQVVISVDYGALINNKYTNLDTSDNYFYSLIIVIAIIWMNSMVNKINK